MIIKSQKHILGIETSCDETAVAIVREDRTILANVLYSQLKEHQPYGGVVPEIAARAHLPMLNRLIQSALDEAKFSTLSELDAVAVTAGPGLIGGVMVGVMMAKSMAFAANLPCIAVNHLEGHALTARLTDNVEFPYLLLLVSGGHCQILITHGIGNYEKLGQTMDDAVGEAFDKVAKSLGLSYPGGPNIEKHAKAGDAKRFHFPRSLTERPGCDFSFSGLKTAVKREIDRIVPLKEQDIADVCASFQQCVADILCNRLKNALLYYTERHSAPRVVVAGGVAANQALKQALTHTVAEFGGTLYVPAPKLCTDNAAMIAWAGMEHFLAGRRDDLSFMPRARWPLTG